MDSSKEEDAPVFLDRSSRLTRGKRMTKLLDEEVEEDELFWNQDALKEDEVDDEYEEEPEVADEFDSDFNEDESEPEEEAENEADERTQTKKRLIFPGKTSSKNKNKKRVVSKVEKPSKDEASTDHSTPPEHHDTPDDTEVERTVRKSTRTSVIVRQAERDAIRAALQATMKPIKRKNPGEEKKMSQEEMLLEAAQTEIMNLRNLERVLAREEEVKKRAIVHKAVYNGPRIRYLSRNGCSYLEFSKGSSFQAELSTTSVPYPEKAVCVITGLPARYRDPKTGLPYATKEAFKTIRERFADDSMVAKEMDMGYLFASLSGNGFSARRKRSTPQNKKEMSYLRHFSRFRQIPAFDSDLSD
ncbi:SWR1 complex subunit 2 isoform X1 [Benincasa hispida]|uniref:SWR1 complex subunit 2 isoform X1 n=1 Tax=Benincasa hispida TaxID=102211 RepID=UPI001900EE44|nr:SWR1 complex subunit 2 isoform X1 [Benincasa hispida]XP_038907262.1 SWR1 complex subunit 2 isoform X1 [Benincasa hispida]XP_038907263.1 SWR1 complex subunit 2 isoform X1 [Benincasa hispida]XP_038907264.1 SWR1 complex subunit 2 isoform X1 [Benincasa hispida]XP_038907265.1 SWR1 complex subunit 2 isoform X1 [Benincasa hispida]